MNPVETRTLSPKSTRYSIANIDDENRIRFNNNFINEYIEKLEVETFNAIRIDEDSSFLNKTQQYFLLWVIWLVVGTIFYANVNFSPTNYSKGIYFAVNVGYSIGWGNLLDNNDSSKIFSIFYLLAGAMFVSRWLVSIIEASVLDNLQIQDRIQLKIKLKKQFTSTNPLLDIYIWCVINSSSVYIIYCWALYIVCGAGWSCAVIGWSIVDGFYFALSSLSTGGLWGIPTDSPDYMFLLVGLYSATGVPLMGLAAANVATIIVNGRKMLFGLKQAHVEEGHIEQELLEIFRMNEDVHVIDRNQYLMLSLVKRGIVPINQVRALYDEFDKVDVDKKGYIRQNKFSSMERTRAASVNSDAAQKIQGSEIVSALHSPIKTDSSLQNLFSEV